MLKIQLKYSSKWSNSFLKNDGKSINAEGSKDAQIDSFYIEDMDDDERVKKIFGGNFDVNNERDFMKLLSLSTKSQFFNYKEITKETCLGLLARLMGEVRPLKDYEIKKNCINGILSLNDNEYIDGINYIRYINDNDKINFENDVNLISNEYSIVHGQEKDNPSAPNKGFLNEEHYLLKESEFTKRFYYQREFCEKLKKAIDENDLTFVEQVKSLIEILNGKDNLDDYDNFFIGYKKVNPNLNDLMFIGNFFSKELLTINKNLLTFSKELLINSNKVKVIVGQDYYELLEKNSFNNEQFESLKLSGFLINDNNKEAYNKIILEILKNDLIFLNFVYKFRNYLVENININGYEDNIPGFSSSKLNKKEGYDVSDSFTEKTLKSGLSTKRNKETDIQFNMKFQKKKVLKSKIFQENSEEYNELCDKWWNKKYSNNVQLGLIKENGTLTIEIDVDNDMANNIKNIIKNSGVTSLTIGKKGLVSVLDIKIENKGN